MDYIRKAAERAHPLFVKNNWTYHGELDVPSVDYLEDVIRGLVHSVKTLDGEPGENVFSATGRFRVQRDVYDDNEEIHVLLELAEDYDELFS